MRRIGALALFLLLIGPACSNNGDNGATATDEPTPRLELSAGELDRAALTTADLGPGWSAEKDAAPSTLQVGGKVGPANVKDTEQDVTTAFKQDEGSGYVTNNLFLLDDADIARAYVDQHRQAIEQKWTQERMDGGGADFRAKGEVSGLPTLGDEMFSAKISTTIRSAEGSETKRKIEYVVYRIDRLLAFVIAQDVGVSKYVRLQEQKVARLVP